MVDNDYELQRRLSLIDPADTQAKLDLINSRARIDGNQAYLAILSDRLFWNQCPEAMQDQTISIVDTALSADYSFVETKSYRCGGEEHRIASFLHNSSGIILNLLPGGTFVMGSDHGEWPEERPAHTRKVDPFLIGRFSVTQEAWDRIGGEDRRIFIGHHLPIVGVSWESCGVWIDKALGALRLPSECEWEYACRAGTTTDYHWGQESDWSYIWHEENCKVKGVAGPRDVRIHFENKKWNAFGLVDMSGNVSEWCSDEWFWRYEDGGYNRQPEDRPDLDRVTRGGAFNWDAEDCHSFYRGGDERWDGQDDVGFRVARDIPKLS
ncbi:MAG: formylglycine-generating enzyme family protein [Planctomycetota bacterium]|nr:formylglycine-generating enzyme family protein [Planctomycetota bacterium]